MTETEELKIGDICTTIPNSENANSNFVGVMVKIVLIEADTIQAMVIKGHGEGNTYPWTISAWILKKTNGWDYE